MATDASSADQLEAWITFSPRQQPSTLPGSILGSVTERPSFNGTSVQTTNIASSVDSACQSPDTEEAGLVTPSTVSMQFASVHIMA